MNDLSVLSRRATLRSMGVFGAAAWLAAPPESGSANAIACPAPAKQDENGVLHFQDMHRSAVMIGFPPPAGQRVTLDNWACSSTSHFRWAHLNPDRLFKTVQIESTDAPAWILPRKMIDPVELQDSHVLWGSTREEARKISIAEWLKRADVDALVVLHEGRIVAECYAGEMTSRTRHIIWCASKSILATVLAKFLIDGTLDEHAEVIRYVPELSQTAFRGATVRQCLDQTTGIYAKECLDATELAKLDAAGKREWDFGSREFQRAHHALAANSRASGLFPRLPEDPFIGFYDFLFTLRKLEREHGKMFNYKDSNCMVLQLALERTTDVPYLEHVRKLFCELGFEQNAGMMLDPLATPLGAFGLTLTPRDFARWGQMVCAGGRVGDGRMLPGVGRLADQMIRDPGPERLDKVWDPGSWPNLGYKNLFWNSAVARGGDLVFHAAGGWGQKCLIDPARQVVVVQLASAWDQSPDRIANNEVGDHAEVAVWSFMQDVLPTLIGER